MQVGWVKIGHFGRKTHYNSTRSSAIAERQRETLVKSCNYKTSHLKMRPVVWHYMRFDTIPKCDRHTQTDGQTHDDGIYRAVKIDHISRPTTAGNGRRSIAKCTVIITYLNDNAQTPLNLFTVYMLYSHLCNKYSENRIDGQT